MLGENTFVVFRKLVGTADGIGSYTDATNDILQMRCKFEKYKSSEAIFNGREAIVCDYVAYCNIPDGVYLDEEMQAVINGKIYAISFIENSGGMNNYYKIYLRNL